jgi:hypothetical protein
MPVRSPDLLHKDSQTCVYVEIDIVDERSVKLNMPIAEIIDVHKEPPVSDAGESKVIDEGAWDKLILPTKIKEDIQVYCDTLRNFRLYLEQEVPIPRGVLFYGPPGCGKTETARVLSKAAGFSFVSLSSADLKVGYIGQAAVAIQRAFDEARTKAPCIVYIDEIEASCPIRTGRQNSVLDREVVAQLLQEMDGIKTNDTAPVREILQFLGIESSRKRISRIVAWLAILRGQDKILSELSKHGLWFSLAERDPSVSAGSSQSR